MKKLLFTIVLLITLSVATNALVLPSTHGDINDYNAPVGSGLLILTALGAGYAIKCRRKNC